MSDSAAAPPGAAASRGRFPDVLFRRWLFVRDYRRFQGGHLKVFDYFRHTTALVGVQPQLYQTPGSDAVADNPWTENGIAGAHPPFDFDVAFLAGTDWNTVDKIGIPVADKPVVNLVQNFVHCNPGDPRYAFLPRPALRICVSTELAQAVRDTRRCAGDIHVVPASIDVASLAAWNRGQRDIDVLVAGMNRTALARDVADRLRTRRPGLGVHLLDGMVGRAQFLGLLGNARVAVLLPQPVEGFYLPPVEAMAMGTAVVTLDALGNREYFVDRGNCLVAAPETDAITAAALTLCDDRAMRDAFVDSGHDCARAYDVSRERTAYAAVLRRAGLLS